MSGAEKCKLCGAKKISHYGPGPRQRLGLYCYGSCHELSEQVYEPAEPSPAPQAQQGFRELKPMTDKDAAAKLREIFHDLQTRFHDQWDWMEADFSVMVLETYLASVTEERDRAQDALRELDRYVRLGRGAIELGITEDGNIGIWLACEEKTLCKGDTAADAIAALKPVSDRQPEGESNA